MIMNRGNKPFTLGDWKSIYHSWLRFKSFRPQRRRRIECL